jgi:hypothetical protein
MGELRASAIAAGSDQQVFELLGEQLQKRLPSRTDPQYVDELRKLPPGLRAMAATYELDVSLALDDFGWHFGNWHDTELAEETAAGLVELGAPEIAELFRGAYQLAQQFWQELGSESWGDWYHGSRLEEAVMPLNRRAWAILQGRWNGIFSYWVEYARRHPERVGALHDA